MCWAVGRYHQLAQESPESIPEQTSFTPESLSASLPGRFRRRDRRRLREHSGWVEQSFFTEWLHLGWQSVTERALSGWKNHSMSISMCLGGFIQIEVTITYYPHLEIGQHTADRRQKEQENGVIFQISWPILNPAEKNKPVTDNNPQPPRHMDVSRSPNHNHHHPSLPNRNPPPPSRTNNTIGRGAETSIPRKIRPIVSSRTKKKIFPFLSCVLIYCRSCC